MKWIVLISMFFSLNVLATEARKHSFLTYKEFMSLPVKKQKEYVEVLQAVVANLGGNPNLAGLEKSLFEPFLRHFVEEAQARGPCDGIDAKKLSNQELLSAMNSVRNCYFLADAGRAARSIETFKRFGITVTPEMNQSNQSTVSPNAARNIQSLSDEYVSRVRAGKIDPQASKANAAYGDLLLSADEVGQITGAAQVKSAASSLRVLENSSVAPKLAPAAAPTPEPTPSPVVVSRKVHKHQCLHSGFLIPENPSGRCQPTKELPADRAYDFFDRKTFVCRSGSEMICNPLVFGFIEECKTGKNCIKKPICILPTQKATEACYAEAKLSQSSENVLKIFQSEKGESIYESLISDIGNLCEDKNIQSRHSSERIKADISATCDVTYQIFKELKDKKFLPYVMKNQNQPAAEATQGER